jgi:carbon monoxide dehydrogenase subunit G
MNFEQRLTVAAPRAAVWDLLTDIPQVASCIPGVTRVEHIDGPRYKGTMGVSVGPIKLNLEGNITIEKQDRETWTAAMKADAAERRIGGGVDATVSLSLMEKSATETELVITTVANFLGRVGEFGQPIIRKKADSTLQDFAKNLQKKLAAG